MDRKKFVDIDKANEKIRELLDERKQLYQKLIDIRKILDMGIKDRMNLDDDEQNFYNCQLLKR